MYDMVLMLDREVRAIYPLKPDFRAYIDAELSGSSSGGTALPSHLYHRSS